ncbi:MAG: class II aldolase/adducin family protein [Olegusella sp.]|nr:class II aldolase/adducin family protein [Olegusella sp.]
MLEELKERVTAVAKRAQSEGLCKHKSGNFSMRDTETGLVVVTPSGVDRDALRPADCVVMDGLRVVEAATGLRPTSEALVHLRIYRERPDVVGVAHTHSQYATTFAVLGRPIPAIVYEASYLHPSKARIPVAPYGRPGTMAAADVVADAIHEADAFLMRSHGAVVVSARDVEDAYLNACYLEEIAELYYHALTAGGALTAGAVDPEALPASELQKWAYPSEIVLPEQ